MHAHTFTFTKRLVAFMLAFLAFSPFANAQISCNAPTFTFYGLGNVFNNPNGVHQAIYELKMTPSGITVDTNNEILGVPNANMVGLGVADLGSGLSFYSLTTNFNAALTLHTTVHRYNGGSWTVDYVDSLFPFSTSNIAGNGNYLYFHHISGYSASSPQRPGIIRRFTGTGFTNLLVDSTDTVSYTVRDIAVDDSGNIYYFTGNDTSDRAKTTHLKIMSPAGVLLQNLPLTINSSVLNLAGCFFQNDTLWVHSGGSNTVNPALYPVTIQGNSAALGAAVAVPRPLLGYRVNPNNVAYTYLAFDDMASCTNTSILSPTGIAQTAYNGAEMVVYPNPAVGSFSVRLPKEGHYRIEVFNPMGQCCYTAQTNERFYTVPCSTFSKGLYHLRVSSAKEQYSTRILIK